MSIIFEMLASKLQPPKDTIADFTDRTIIITGANTGLGFESAVKFVQQGAKRVVIAVRSTVKGDVARVQIEQRTGRTGVVEVWQLDMLDYDSIQAFSRRVNTEIDCLDIVVLNAGVFVAQHETSKYGWERTLQVNLLSTTLLSLLLLPKLKRSKSTAFTPVLEIVNSGLHERAKLSPEVLTGETEALVMYNRPDRYDGQTQYGVSKLLLMYMVQQLADNTNMLNGKHDVLVLAVCPGAAKSELARDMSGPVLNAVKAVMYALLFRTTEQGARSYISGTLVGEDGHGRFWQHDTIKPQAPLLTGADGAAMQKMIWESVTEALAKDVPVVHELRD